MRTTRALLLICFGIGTSLCCAANKTVSFRDLTGNVYTNVTVLKVEKDGVLFRYGEEFKYVRVKFTNMTEEVQLQCGYDAKAIQRQKKEKAEAERQQRMAAQAEFEKQQALEINSLAVLVRPISTADFPKTESAKTTCKELVAELKGVNTGLELGMTYNKFSELLTDTAIKIQKTRDLAKDELPTAFQIRMDDCIRIYNTSRDDWRRSIETGSHEVKVWSDYFRQQAWSKSGIHLTMLRGIIDGQTNVNSLVIDQAVALVSAERRAVEDGLLPGYLRSYAGISLLSEDEIVKHLKEELAH